MGERIFLKLTSTKFWTYLSVLAVCIFAIGNENSDISVQITALIVALGDCVCYVFGNVQQKKIADSFADELSIPTIDAVTEDYDDED